MTDELFFLSDSRHQHYSPDSGNVLSTNLKRERESLNPFRTHICQRRLHFQNEIEEEERKGNNKRRRVNYVLKRGDAGIFLINLKGHQLFSIPAFRNVGLLINTLV